MRIATKFFAVMALSLTCCFASADITEYTITFQGNWTNSVPRPGGAHFSPLIGSTHEAGGSFMAVGQTASTGVENVAEVGSTAALAGEINAGINAGTAHSLFAPSGDIGPEGTSSFNIFVDSDFSMISLITMIAPSPDWFVGVHDLDLLDGNGNWISQIQLDLNSYDAGTEDGQGFSTSNNPTNPQGVITALDVAEPAGALFGAGSIASITLTRNIPEPGSLTLLAFGTFAFVARRRR